VVAVVLVGASLLSVLVVGVVNYFSARELLTETVEAHLIDVAASRAVTIEEGMAFVGDVAAFVSTDAGVAEALTELSEGFAALDERLTPAQTEELVAYYEGAITRETPPGLERPTVERFFPESERARYLQYHYLAQNPFNPASEELVDAADGSAYSAAHAQHHPVLRELSENTGLGDLILVDAVTSSIVYTVDKRVDFGTNLAAGPYSESGLAEVVLDQLSTAAAGEAVVVDFSPYIPAGGAPTLFVAAAIRDEGRVIGAVAFEVPNELVGDITTAGGDWEGTGLGDTGEIYIVGPDRLMRSTSRLWLEDSAAYLDAVAKTDQAPEVTEAAETFDTTVLIQPVDTEAVATALSGDFFNGVTRNYLGQETLTVAGDLDVAGVDWVMVAEVTIDEAHASLRSYIQRILLIAAILIPFVALVGILLAHRLMRPVRPIVTAAKQVSEGDLEVELPAEGRDEFAELGRRFNSMVGALREQASELARADAETTELLSAVLPDQLVDQVKQGDQNVAEAVRNATLIAITAGIDPQTTAADPDELLDMNTELQVTMRKLAEGYAVEQLLSSASQQVFATGLQTDDLGAERAVDFVSAAREAAVRFGELHEVETEFRAGLAAGDVVAGVVGTERMAFDVWGHPSRLAVALGAVAQPGDVLVDDAVAEAVGDHWQLEQDMDLVGLGGENLAGSYLRGRRDTSGADA
jgi:class 3 adenylate cyclase